MNCPVLARKVPSDASPASSYLEGLPDLEAGLIHVRVQPFQLFDGNPELFRNLLKPVAGHQQVFSPQRCHLSLQLLDFLLQPPIPVLEFLVRERVRVRSRRGFIATLAQPAVKPTTVEKTMMRVFIRWRTLAMSHAGAQALHSSCISLAFSSVTSLQLLDSHSDQLVLDGICLTIDDDTHGVIPWLDRVIAGQGH